MPDWPEWTPDDWRRSWTASRGPLAVFVHTPLCGTCKAARRMLEVSHALAPEWEIVDANLNWIPEMAQIFRIESVPCLIIKSPDGSVSKYYRFGSVPEMVERFKRVSNRGGPLAP